ncbi:MAG: hypothetical protein ACYDCC_09660 [Actinomycetota bacterium]
MPDNPMFFEEMRGLGEGRKRREYGTSRAADHRVKKVCRSCNGIWMSKLEEEVKPYLVPMIRGESLSLSENEQLVVATWAAKTAFVAEARNARVQTLSTPEERAFLKEQRCPPASVFVRLARYDGRSGVFRRVARIDARGPESKLTKDEIEHVKASPNIASTLLCLGELGVHVMHDTSGLYEPLKQIGVINDRVVTIWPTRASVTWPPARIFDEAGLDALAVELFPNAYWPDGMPGLMPIPEIPRIGTGQ